MVEKFIEEFAKLIANEPHKIRVEKEQLDEKFIQIIIFAGNNDAGKLIGKDGKMIGSIKTLISGCKAKDGNSYKVIVKSSD